MPIGNNLGIYTGGGGGSGVVTSVNGQTGDVNLDSDDIPQGTINKYAAGDAYDPEITIVSGATSVDNISASYSGNQLTTGGVALVTVTCDIVTDSSGLVVLSIPGPGGEIASVDQVSIEVIQLNPIDGLGGVGNVGNTGSGWQNDIVADGENVTASFECALPLTAYRANITWQYKIA